MKKILLLFIMIFNWGFSQKNFGNTAEPMPSVSSFSSYVNTPVSQATGVPNISIPLFSLPTGSADVNISTMLSYHPYNAVGNKPGSEVGLGWSLSKGGVISRVINGDVDEIFSNPARSNYKKNVFDDVYYYDIPGESGKFRIIRDTVNNTFSINNISGNTIKIEYTRESNAATLILNSFTITNDKGIRYVFEDYSVSRNDGGAAAFTYKSAFFLTRIIDANNLVAAAFSYRKDAKYSANIILYQVCKLQEISTKYGKITFDYYYMNSGTDNGKNDPYQLEMVALLDASSHPVSRYRLMYGTFSNSTPVQNNNEDKRTLTRLHKMGKGNTLVEVRSFEYDKYGSETNYSPSGNPDEYGNFLCSALNTFKNPRMNTLGLLKKMTLPEGGYVEYDFEAGETYADMSQISFTDSEITHPEVQFMSLYKTLDFDTKVSREYSFQVTQAKRFFLGQMTVDVYTIPNIHGDITTPPDYKLLNAAGNEIQGALSYTCNGIRNYSLVPGTYTLKFKGNGNGYVRAFHIASLPPPYKNRAFNELPRISGIKYYASYGILKKSVTYEYHPFGQPNDADGQYFSSEVCNNEDYIGGSLLYRNVKETYYGESGTTGYTKYYFRMPDDYPGTADYFYKPYYNLVSSGILTKKEVFSPQGQMVSDENTDYVFDEIPNVAQYSICGTYRSRTAWMKSSVTVARTFFNDGSSLQGSTETYCNAGNLQPYLIRETAPDGKVTEKKISYAADLGHTRLSAANMISVPVRTEVKTDGVVVSRSETRYDHVASLYPSSAAGFNRQTQDMVTEALFDAYDSNGNLLQATDKSGIPVTTIWGYHGTQPIATVTGLPYSQLKDLQAVKAAIAASDADADDPAQEANLLLALENLRKDPALQAYSVSAATYNPLTGITNSLSPNGIRTSYLYDSANRLIKITDGDGKTLKEYQYNYKYQ